MRQFEKDRLPFLFTALLVWMILSWSQGSEAITYDTQSTFSVHAVSGRSQHAMVLQDGIQIHAEEPNHVSYNESESGDLPFSIFSTEITARIQRERQVQFPEPVTLNFTSEDVVFPFHEFT
jgi:hypothetical protein